jgi:hypothetical protein
MGCYRSLFSVSIGHGYFSDGEWDGLVFVPTPATMKLFESTDVLVRPMKSGVSVLFCEDRSSALSLYADDAEGMLRLNFKVYSGDRGFANFTMPSTRKGDAILYFDNRDPVCDDENGKLRISKDKSVSEKDFRDMDALIAEGVLSERDRRVPPDFLVDIFIKPDRDRLSGAVVWNSLELFLKFSARQSFWRYFLVGNMSRNNPYIVDLDNQVEFEPHGDVVLPGNRPAKMFRSKELIPVLEKSPYRFQLRDQSQGGSRVLIKRLPVASENRLGMDVINGKKEIVLDSYVTC